MLVNKRDEEIAELESYLKEKEKVIAQLEQKLKQQMQKPTYALPKGDLLDEMIGQYIN